MSRRTTYRYMKMIRHRGWTIALVAALLSAGGMNGVTCTVQPVGGNNNPPGTTVDPDDGAPPLVQADVILGDPNAPLTVIEYGDFECPFCGSFARNAFPQVRAEFIDTGRVRWIFRNFPLDNIHPRARPVARAAECAAQQNAFWAYHDRLFENQDDLSDAALRDHAEALGLSLSAFDACVAGPAIEVRVDEDVNSGMALGVTSTPTFFVGSEQVTGDQTAEEMAQAINRKLNGD